MDEDLPEGFPYLSSIDPFRGWSSTRLQAEVDNFLASSQLYTFKTDIRRGALLAQAPTDFERWGDAAGRSVFEGDENRPPEILSHEKENLIRELGLKSWNSTSSPAASVKGDIAARSEKSIENKWGELRSNMKQYWYQRASIHALVACCSLGAAIQGWDETAVNGAQVLYQCDLGINRTVILGLCNSAPYLMCTFSCFISSKKKGGTNVIWPRLTEPLNNLLGRKGTIIFTCLFSFSSCLGQAFVHNWKQLLACRLLLGFGIGPKTATIPIYAAESVPELIRGAFVMQWQLWDALGIMAGLVTCYIFRNTGATWRIMLGSPMIAAAVLLFLMLSMPESPRWHLLKAYLAEPGSHKRHKHYEQAFLSLWRLRHTTLQAGRDLFLLDRLITIEMKNLVHSQENRDRRKPKYQEFQASLAKHRKLFTNKRCRNAMIATLIVMVWQQLCGINVLAYYSSSVFLGKPPTTTGSNCTASTGISAEEKQAISTSFAKSMGLGAVNFTLALPALFLIDILGRRALLLLTFPLMFVTFLAAGLSYLASGDTQQTMVITFCFLFMAVYSVGEGPVPLVYASESLPLVVRDTGIGVATATYWGFNFLVAITWPPFYDGASLHHGIGFGFYAVLCAIGFFLIAMFVPETKRLHLEQLDNIFSLKYGTLARIGLGQVSWAFLRIFGMTKRPCPGFLDHLHKSHSAEDEQHTDIEKMGSFSHNYVKTETSTDQYG